MLSESVANAPAFYGDPATKETECFVRNMDSFFDCHNVRCCRKYRRRRKPNLAPYTQESDERLMVSVCACVQLQVLFAHVISAVAQGGLPRLLR